MPILSNPRHELFAQELAKGRSAVDAYRAATGKDNRRYASELGHRPDILGRVAFLLSERAKADAEATAMATEALSVDKQWLIEKAEEARLMAMANKQSAAAIAAVKELGILSGFRVEKRENFNSRSADDYTDDELADIAAGGPNRLQ
jgi:hypothetical protein